MVDALVKVINAENSLRDFVVNSTIYVYSKLLPINANLCSNTFDRGEEPASILLYTLINLFACVTFCWVLLWDVKMRSWLRSEKTRLLPRNHIMVFLLLLAGCHWLVICPRMRRYRLELEVYALRHSLKRRIISWRWYQLAFFFHRWLRVLDLGGCSYCRFRFSKTFTANIVPL